jgi:hypothetical protein
MHNLHYVRITSTNPEDACSEVESQISDWGTENNWRTIGGCVSQDDEVYVIPRTGTWGNSRWAPEENTTIDDINKQVREWLVPDEYYKKAFDACVEGTVENPFDWYGAKRHCEKMYQIESFKKHNPDREFDVLRDHFYDWEFNENGVTGIDDHELGEDEKIYIVYVDMHD